MNPDRPPTAFEEKVYEALSSVPRGRVTSYALLARQVGCGSAQAIGQAMKRNPRAPEVPCHRVLRADGTLGGYSGQVEGEQLEKKRALLESEGVRFEDGRLVGKFWDFSTS